MLHRNNKEIIMLPLNDEFIELNTLAIEQEARRLRAVEMQRMYAIMGKRIRASGHQLAKHVRTGLAAIGSSLRWLAARSRDSMSHRIANGH